MVYEFAGHTLDTRRFELARDGEPIHVEPQVFRSVFGRGYQFVAPVTVVEPAEDAADPVRGDPVRAHPVEAGADATATATDGPHPFVQRIHFCCADDGTRLAYAVSGEGPVLVKAANWMTHLDLDATPSTPAPSSANSPAPPC